MEIFMNDGSLCSPDEWRERIDSFRQGTHEDANALAKLPAAISKAVAARIPKSRSTKIGLLLSGGVDSSLIALLLKEAKVDFICYTIGFKNEDTKDPEDVGAARSLANKLGLNLKVRLVDANEAEELIMRTAAILGPNLSNVVNVGVASVEVGCLELAKKDGVKLVFGGLGSEEIFAGYERHKKSSEINEECWAGLLRMYERDLLRDFSVLSFFNMAAATPFLDEDLIKLAMKIPGKNKISGEHSKLCLREAAEKLGLPDEFAWRKKRAAQYGSRLDSALDKIARKHGFGFKKDYLSSLK